MIASTRIVGDPIARFHTKYKVNPITGCWEWIGTLDSNGYGLFTIGERKKLKAHRFSYENFVGPIPEGHMVLHRCDVPRCVKPSDLFTGTAKDNAEDCRAKGRLSGQTGTAKAKLTFEMAQQMRIMYARDLAKGTASMERIAKLYGITPETVRRVLHGKSHLKPRSAENILKMAHNYLA